MDELRNSPLVRVAGLGGGALALALLVLTRIGGSTAEADAYVAAPASGASSASAPSAVTEAAEAVQVLREPAAIRARTSTRNPFVPLVGTGSSGSSAAPSTTVPPAVASAAPAATAPAGPTDGVTGAPAPAGSTAPVPAATVTPSPKPTLTPTPTPTPATVKVSLDEVAVDDSTAVLRTAGKEEKVAAGATFAGGAYVLVRLEGGTCATIGYHPAGNGSPVPTPAPTPVPAPSSTPTAGAPLDLSGLEFLDVCEGRTVELPKAGA